MQVLQLKTCVGKDGLLRLEIPTEWRNIDLEVCVVLNPLPKFEEASVTKVHPDYPEGFFERTIGKWEGEFEYLDQGIAEERDPTAMVYLPDTNVFVHYLRKRNSRLGQSSRRLHRMTSFCAMSSQQNSGTEHIGVDVSIKMQFCSMNCVLFFLLCRSMETPPKSSGSCGIL